MWAIKGLLLNKTFVANPSLKTAYDNLGRFVIELPTEGLAINGLSSLEKVIEIFKVPVTFGDAISLGISGEILKKLIYSRVIVSSEISAIMARGTTSEARSSISYHKTDLLDLNSPFVLIGSSVDFAQVGQFSSFRGPDSIRRCLGVHDNLADLGDVTWNPCEGLLEYGMRLGYVISMSHEKNAVPIILGGDHTLTYFSVSEVCKSGINVGVIQFDAHNDLGESHRNSDPYNLYHANVAGYLRKLPISFLLQVGLRDSQIGFTTSKDECPLYQVGETEVGNFSKILANVIKTYPVDAVYISVDLDCINPEEAPDVTTPLNGSLTFSDVKRCFQQVLEVAPVIGADFVEVTSSLEFCHAAQFSAELIKILIESEN